MFGLDERINTIPVSCIELASAQHSIAKTWWNQDAAMSEDVKSLPTSTSKVYETAFCMSTTKSPEIVTDNLKKSQRGPVQKYQHVLYSLFVFLSFQHILQIFANKTMLSCFPCFQYYPELAS